jgi:hypothetical protein
MEQSIEIMTNRIADILSGVFNKAKDKGKNDI